MSSMFLTDAEIDAMCEGLGPTSHSAKIKRLASMGLIVNRKPNGRPLVVRSHAEAVLDAPVPATAVPVPAPAVHAPHSIPWEETPLGRMQALERQSRAEEARLRALQSAAPRPTRAALRAAQEAEERRRKEARAALVRFHTARRRVVKLRRTPPWANQAAILAIYEQARALTTSTGVVHHVDHKIPLQGELVSGLHVHHNLQILTGSENSKKRNRFEVEP